MDNELKHYRTPGSKNGVRLYQYPDGSLTPAGEQRYLKGRMYLPSTEAVRKNSIKNASDPKEAFYNVGLVGPTIHSVNNLKDSYTKYKKKVDESFKNHNKETSLGIKISGKVLKKTVDCYTPVKKKMDEAVYTTYNKIMSENARRIEGKNFAEECAKTNEILEKIEAGLKEPSYGIYMLIKYLIKK